jgi:hypothetical protein
MTGNKITSIDTETVGGYARILSTPYRTWMSYDFENCVHPLMIDARKKLGKRYFMFNLNFDCQAILKYLPLEVLRDLQKEHEATYEQYYIFFIRNKLMKLRDYDARTTLSFYDVAQFYNYIGLDNASKKYLNDKKQHNPIISNVMKHQDDWPQQTMEDYFITNSDIIGKYCKHDAILTQKLGYLVQQDINELFNVTMRNYSSKAKIAEKLTDLKSYPKFDINSTPGRYAYYTFGGGIFDTWQRGIFDDITEIDISSAYPYRMVMLDNLRNGNFHKIESDDDILDTDYYGWVLAAFDCFMFPFKSGDIEKWKGTYDGKEVDFTKRYEKVYYANGKRYKPITLIEYQFLQKYGFKPILYNGYVWRKTSNIFPKPFAWIDDVYKLKQKYKPVRNIDFKYSLCKIAMNGGYGKTVQKVGYPAMQNFFYGSYITAPTRVQIMEMIIDNNLFDRVISIATDGINIQGKFTLKNNTTGLGSWDTTYYNKCLMLGNGMYQLNGEEQKTALRGVTNKRNYDLMSLLQKSRNKTEIIPMQHKKRPVTLNMGINFVKIYTKKDINVFKERNRIISINSDRSKHWYGIEKFGDLLDNNYKPVRFTIEELLEKELK